MPLNKSDGPPVTPLFIWLQGLQAAPWLIEAAHTDSGIHQLLHQHNTGSDYSLAQLYCVVGKYMFERAQRLNTEITDLYLRTMPPGVIPSKQ